MSDRHGIGVLKQLDEGHVEVTVAHDAHEYIMRMPARGSDLVE
jgi:hypothetical protein